MFRRLKYKKAQTIMSEYLLIFFIILGMISAMTVYFRRAVQGRLHDAQRYVFRDMVTRINEALGGDGSDSYNIATTLIFYREYEPYYANIQSNTYHGVYDEDHLISDQPGKTGIYRKNVDETTTVRSKSVTGAPQDSD